MSQKSLILVMSIFLLAILVTGGVFFVLLWQRIPVQEQAFTSQTPDSGAVATLAAQTIMANFTQMAMEGLGTPTSTPEPPKTESPTTTSTTENILPTNTPVPTIINPSITPIPPTMIVPTFTPKPVVCDSAQFVRDVSVEDNSPFAPGSKFTKIWRLINTGSCTWNQDYDLVLVSGDAMDAQTTIALPKKVEPNQTIDLSVTLKAPSKNGTYRGDWMLRNPSGTRFGIGPKGEKSFWVQIQVMNLENTNLAYDFAANYCKADWSSGTGSLPCPGTSSSTDGFVILLDAPHLENRQEDEWTLLTHPNNYSRGWISGMYPEFTIQQNHHFTAWVGCMEASKGCNVIFRLDFKNLKTGNIKNLGSWYEVYDGDVTKIDLDLSEHAGKNVRFILTVSINGGNPTRANAFWFVPGIIKEPSPTSTPTLTPPTPTETPTPTGTPTETPTTIP